MRQAPFTLSIAAIGVAAIVGTQFFPSLKATFEVPTLTASPTFHNPNAEIQKAMDFLALNEPEKALLLIQQHKAEMEALTPEGIQWLELFVKASFEMKDTAQLTVLFEFFPEIFKDQEAASLFVADSYIINNQPKDYLKIRSLWTDRETKVAAWMVLDADRLLLEGRRKEALQLLQSRTFSHKADVGRLIRLALILTNEDPKKAWAYLGEAYAKDPQNPDVRSYRAKLLESVGKSTLAHREYQAASRLDPQNLFLKDQLAEFYVRQGQYPQALAIWQENLTAPSLDTIWIKTLFWSKIAKPITFDWKENPMPQGNLDPLIQYLVRLNPDEFWNQNAFNRVANRQYFLKNRQETFWLQLASFLLNQQENEANQMLKYNPFTATSWNPELEVALKRVLAYRNTGSLKLNPSDFPPKELSYKKPKETESSLFQDLEELAQEEENQAVPEGMRNLLLSKEIFSALFIAAGWNEIGLKLHTLAVIPNDFPDSVVLGLAKAIQENRSSLEAMEFAAVQEPSPELTLYVAELQIAGGDSEEALQKLIKLAQVESEVGYRSAWLSSLIFMEKGNYEQARIAIYSHPHLAYDQLGQETLARIAHQDGDTDLAVRLYAAIEKDSPEARSYLARKAFNDKDWKRARELTEQLIKDYPDNALLKENLEKIKEEEKKELEKKAL